MRGKIRAREGPDYPETNLRPLVFVDPPRDKCRRH